MADIVQLTTQGSCAHHPTLLEECVLLTIPQVGSSSHDLTHLSCFVFSTGWCLFPVTARPLVLSPSQATRFQPNHQHSTSSSSHRADSVDPYYQSTEDEPYNSSSFDSAATGPRRPLARQSHVRGSAESLVGKVSRILSRFYIGHSIE